MKICYNIVNIFKLDELTIGVVEGETSNLTCLLNLCWSCMHNFRDLQTQTLKCILHCQIHL